MLTSLDIGNSFGTNFASLFPSFTSSNSTEDLQLTMVSLSELLIPAFVTYLGWRTFQYYSAHKSNPGFVSIFNPSFLLIKALPLRSSRWVLALIYVSAV